MKHRLLTFCLLIALLFPGLSLAGNTATSGVTAGTIIDRVVRDMAGVTDYCTTQDLLQWTNDAVREVVAQTRCLETGVSTLVITSLGRSYSLSNLNWLDIEKVEHDSGVTWTPGAGGTTTFNPNYIYDLERVAFANLRLGNEKETGKPKSFAVWNNSLYIWPIPSTTLTGTTLYVYYLPAVSGVTATTSAIETPSYFDPAIRDYVRAYAFYKDEQREQGDYFLALFYKRIQSYLANILRRNVFSVPQPVPAQ